MPSPTPRLVGRADACGQIERLLEGAKAGHSAVLVVRGEPGIGKSSLLDYAIGSASGFQVARATGVESEMELAFAGLHQLVAPMLDGLVLLPDPQRDAMTTALGLSSGRPPDRFLIGLALLSLLTDAAGKAPVLVVVDDAHWLDLASAHALAFAARRLFADRVCVLFGTRPAMGELRGLPELALEGLADRDAAALLAAVLPVPLDPQVRDRLITETRGNPLALLEWPRGLAPAELAGGFGLSTLLPVAGQIEEGFRRQLGELPTPARALLTVAAAEPTGDAALVWRAAAQLGLGPDDATAATDAGLVELATTVRFRHPSVRSAVYAAATTAERRQAHAALATATDPHEDADRRAWHLALAAAGPDEEVAAELERSAGVAQGRGGVSAAAALLERSAALTLDPTRRTQRTIAAAGAYIDAGAPEEGARLLSAAEAGPLDAPSRARVEVLRATSATAWGWNGEAARLFLSAATRLYGLDARMARDLLAAAMGAAAQVDVVGGVTLDEAAKAARAAPPPPDPVRPQDLLLDGLATFIAEGPELAAAILRSALGAFRRGRLEPAEGIHWYGFQCSAATALWDLETWELAAEGEVHAARTLGALRALPQSLNMLAVPKMFGGDLSTAAALVGEATSLIEATGSNFTLYAVARLAALRGDEAEAVDVIATTIDHAQAQGQGMSKRIAHSAAATLYNGLARYDEAFSAAQEADRPHFRYWASNIVLHELVEAAARSRHSGVAAEALERISASAQASGSDWALGIEARSRALLSTGDVAESLYLEAIERLERSPVRPEAARAHLLYGEWLRREKRRVDARARLRDAYERLTTIGMEAFAERARRELAATGETARKRATDTAYDLTPQETQIAQLAGEGRTNREIGTQLFISAHTVEYHLKKVFTKMDVTSRTQLRDSLARRSASVEAGI
jgi:DNA-binding CsgD family transcriptional regulator